MHHTPFEDAKFLDLLSKHGVEMTARASHSDFLVCSRLKPLLPRLLVRPWTKAIIWTNEPRNSGLVTSRLKPFGLSPDIRVMNVFTGDVFWHHLHFLGSYHFDTAKPLGIDLDSPLRPFAELDIAARKPTACALFTYRVDRKTAFHVNGANVDLETKRTSYALALHRRNLCDIYGHNWPRDIPIAEDSGYWNESLQTPWWTRKLELLNRYRFNLCVENTSAAHYCTEKLWHAIAGGTLPIYDSGNNRIYETFPRGSFIDLQDFRAPEELIEFLNNLSNSDCLRRVNACRETYNHCLVKRKQTIDGDLILHVRNIVRALSPTLIADDTTNRPQ